MNTIRTHLGKLKTERALNGVVSTLADVDAFPLGMGYLKRVSLELGTRLYCVIGGCEAIRDMYDARTFGVDGLIAPMIDSRYALEKFTEAVASVYGEDERDTISLGIVFASDYSIENAADILSSNCSGKISSCIIDIDTHDNDETRDSLPDFEAIGKSVSIIRSRGCEPVIQTSSTGNIPFIGEMSVKTIQIGAVLLGLSGDMTRDRAVMDAALSINNEYEFFCSGGNRSGES